MPVTRSDYPALTDETAERLLATAVANLRREYPVHWSHIVTDDADLVPHRVLHPVFAGSLDWHSCVHQTWLAVRLLRLRPHLPSAPDARRALDALLTAEGGQAEAAFFTGPTGAFWERPYGWAWLLVLDAELRTWPTTPSTPTSTAPGSTTPGSTAPTSTASGGGNSGQHGGEHNSEHVSEHVSEHTGAAERWATNLRPLGEVLREHYLRWVSRARLPIRAGTHANTAFATGMVLDAARAVGDTELAQACTDAALRWHRDDRGYGGFEPDAADFLSPALVEADLVRRVLPDFAAWFEAFLPDLADDRWQVLRDPVPVDDPADPHGSHLVGLALSRAWCWRKIAATLSPDHRYATLAHTAAIAHERAGTAHVLGHGYYAEHWLGTFAAYLTLGAF